MTDVRRRVKSLGKRLPPIAWRDQQIADLREEVRHLRSEVRRHGGKPAPSVSSRPGAGPRLRTSEQVQLVRDSGLFAPRSPDAVELPTAKPAAKSAAKDIGLPAREHISLKPCQHIVSLHGGQLREETEDGLRNFLVDLPTGAPHRDDQSQLDIAQAQQYARDLAALMTRARTQRRESNA